MPIRVGHALSVLGASVSLKASRWRFRWGPPDKAAKSSEACQAEASWVAQGRFVGLRPV